MMTGLGALRLSPDAFWNMTIPELTAARDGFVMARGGKGPDDHVSEEDIRALEQRCRDEGLI